VRIVIFVLITLLFVACADKGNDHDPYITIESEYRLHVDLGDVTLLNEWDRLKSRHPQSVSLLQLVADYPWECGTDGWNFKVVVEINDETRMDCIKSVISSIELVDVSVYYERLPMINRCTLEQSQKYRALFLSNRELSEIKCQ